MNIAVVLAAGSGSRIGGDVPKQFIQVKGRLIIEYTLDVFENHPLIDTILVVCKNEFINKVQNLIKQNNYKKVLKIITGGQERYQSSICAIKECHNDNDVLIFHDAARPMVTQRIITDCIAALRNYDAATVVVNTTDTIYIVDSTGNITDIPQRKTLRNAQTPQCFKRSVIKKAYDKALSDKAFIPTDDCSVVHKYLSDARISTVNGDTSNIKITYPEDIELFEKLLNKQS